MHPLHGNIAKLEQEFKVDDHKNMTRNYGGLDGTAEEDFHLWSLKVKAALEIPKPAPWLCEKNVHNTADKQGRAIIIAALGNSPLRAIQDYQSTNWHGKVADSLRE